MASPKCNLVSSKQHLALQWLLKGSVEGLGGICLDHALGLAVALTKLLPCVCKPWLQ